MPDVLFVPALAVLCALILLGIHLMSRVRTALLATGSAPQAPCWPFC